MSIFLDETYKEHRILVSVVPNGGLTGNIFTASISWDHHGRRRTHFLNLDEHHENSDAAMAAALIAAKSWIDSRLYNLL